MFGIKTKYRGPTNSSGSRIVATGPDGVYKATPFDHSLNATGNHRKAAVALMRKMDRSLDGLAHTSGYLGGGEYTHVFVPQEEIRIENMRAQAEEAVAEFEKDFYKGGE
tara:strand:- start:620 stop:946 length:327 start_codon:yes stop_codon:yes gene_type:complete